MQRHILLVSHRDPSLLRIALWTWLACGFAVTVLFPALRGSDPLFGWLPFWFVVAPLIDLALLHRNRLMMASHALLVRVRRRRRPTLQARRLRHRRARLQPLLTAQISR